MKLLCQYIVVAKEQRAMGSGAAAAPAKNIHFASLSVYEVPRVQSSHFCDMFVVFDRVLAEIFAC